MIFKPIVRIFFFLITLLSYSCLEKYSEALDAISEASDASQSSEMLPKSIDIRGDFNATLEFSYNESNELIEVNSTYYEKEMATKKTQATFEYGKNKQLQRLIITDKAKTPNASEVLEWDTTDLQYASKPIKETIFFNGYDNIIYQYQNRGTGKLVRSNYLKSNDIQYNLEKIYEYNAPNEPNHLSEIKVIESGDLQTISSVFYKQGKLINPMARFSDLIPILTDLNMGGFATFESPFFGIPCIILPTYSLMQKQVFNVNKGQKSIYNPIYDTVVIEVVAYIKPEGSYYHYPTDIKVSHAGVAFYKVAYNKSYVAHIEYH